MSRITAILVAVMAVASLPVNGIEIVQTTGGLVEGTDWVDDENGTITIKIAHADKTFVFWAHEDGQPNTLAQIENIARDTVNLTSGTIKVKVSKSGGPGATAVNDISFDTANITSIVEGISVTGNFLTTAITVDHITGPIEVGGSLTAGMTVNEDLEGDVLITDTVVTGATIRIKGDALNDIVAGELQENLLIDGSLLGTVTVIEDLDANITVGDAIDGGASIEIGGDMVAFSRIAADSFEGDIDIAGYVDASNLATFDFDTFVSGASLRVQQAHVVDTVFQLENVPLHFKVGFENYYFGASNPAFWNSVTHSVGGGGPADTDHTLDITVTRPSAQTDLAATIIVNDPGTPFGPLDLKVPMNLASLTLAPELLNEPFALLHNVYVDGNVNVGANEYAIDMPDAAVNSVYIGGELGSEDGEENLFDRIRVASIGTLAFGSLGSEDLYVPEDGVSGSGTAVIEADEFLRSNEFILDMDRYFDVNMLPQHYYYSHADSSGSPAGFISDFTGAPLWLTFYHRSPTDGCIRDSCAGEASWCCAKGPVADIDNDGNVGLIDFTTFATCFSLTEPEGGCSCDAWAHSDLDADGDIDLADFATLSIDFGFTGAGASIGCCSSPPCEPGEPDLEFIQEFLEETIEPLISGDNDWVESIQALTAEIAAFEPEEDYEGIVDALDAINFMPVAVDSTNTVAKNGSKIMSLGTATDPDGDTLLVDLVTTDPAHGTISEAAYDFYGNLVSFRYTPDTDYTGEDTLTWRATEVGTSQEYYAEAVITITVTE